MGTIVNDAEIKNMKIPSVNQNVLPVMVSTRHLSDLDVQHIVDPRQRVRITMQLDRRGCHYDVLLPKVGPRGRGHLHQHVRRHGQTPVQVATLARLQKTKRKIFGYEHDVHTLG